MTDQVPDPNQLPQPQFGSEALPDEPPTPAADTQYGGFPPPSPGGSAPPTTPGGVIPGYAPTPGYGPPPGYVPPPGSVPPPGYGAPPPASPYGAAPYGGQPGYGQGYGGYPQSQPTAQGYGWPQGPAAPRTNPLAIVSLVTGILGIIPGLGILMVILGVVFGAIAVSQINKGGGVDSGKGLAVAGIIISLAITAIWIFLLVLGILGGHLHPANNN